MLVGGKIPANAGESCASYPVTHAPPVRDWTGTALCGQGDRPTDNAKAALEEQAFTIRSGSGFGRSTFWFRVPQQLGLQVFETPDEIRQLLSHEASAPALSVVRVSKDFVFIAAFWY